MNTKPITRIVMASVLGLAVSSTELVAQTTNFAPDQQVEVREGDEWSAATVLKKEGRKYQIKYADDTEEWVTADRLRAVGAEDGAPVAGGPATKPAGPKKSDVPVYTRGQKLEVKDNAFWRPATIVNRRGDWYLIEYERRVGASREWVEPWRIRKLGSTYDVEGWHSNPRIKNNEGPPRPEPGEAPKAGEKKDPFAPKPYDKPVAEANTDKADDVLPTGGPSSLMVFDALPTTPKLSERAYVLRGKSGMSGPADVFFAGARGVVVYTAGMGNDVTTSQIELLDLVNGKNDGAFDFDPLSNPIAISASGKRLLGRAHGFHGGTRNRVDLFDLASGGATKHLTSFVPYAASGNANKGTTDVDWAAFVDDDHVLTYSNGGSLVLWDAPKATAVWRMPVQSRTTPGLSPGGKQVAVMTADGLVIVEALTGKPICSIDGSRPVEALQFTPDGRRVVGSTGTIVTAWDLGKGEMLGDIGMPTTGARGGIIPTDGTNVLIGSTDLLDLDRKAVVWKYTGANPGTVAAHGGLCFAVVREGDRSMLTTARLPHPTVAATLATAQLPPLLVKPGDTVTLEVAIEGTEDQRAKIADAMTKQLKASGINVGAGQQVKLIARTEQGETRTQTYQQTQFRFGGPPLRSEETVSVTDKITRVYFEVNGKVAWENRTVSTTPWHVSMKEGQSINQAVQAASQFNLAFLESVRVPVYVPQPGEQQGVGKSRWSIGGVKDDK